MRLFLLPISTRSSLIYCQRVNNQLSSKTTFADKITTRVSGVWLKWEKAEKGWQKKVTSYGNRLFQTIPHEEWGLKSIPPISKRRSEEELLGKEHVDLVFPASVINEREVTEALRRYAGDERQAFHTRWMWGAIAGMPIAAPVALLPVSAFLRPNCYKRLLTHNRIPNLPFFYLVFRAWSHWRGHCHPVF